MAPSTLDRARTHLQGARRVLASDALDGALEALVQPRRRLRSPHGVPDRSVDAAIVRGLHGADLAEIQRVLRPGAPLLVLEAERPRAARRLLAHYFDVDPETGRPLVARTRRLDSLAGHFNEIAPTYATEIPPHVRDHYLQQKLGLLERLLGPGWERGRGLDVGCGLGWYANEIAARGGRVVAMDSSLVPIRIGRGEAMKGAPRFIAGDSLRLPIRTASFDYAYAINMIHHLKRGEQGRALAEVRRVLKPGAPLIVFEINVRNPLFRWYMRHVFPRRRSIDRGDEEFLLPEQLPLGPGFRLERVLHATFTADFLPPWLLRPMRRVERLLERSPAARYSIHYAALLRAS